MPLKNLTEWIQFVVSRAAILFAIGFAIIAREQLRIQQLGMPRSRDES